jgi:hypothetical protein
MTLVRNALIAAIGATVLVSAGVVAQQAGSSASAPAEASIPFVNQRGVRDWQAAGDDKVYVQASGGQWYLATLAVNVPDLPFAQAIGFETKGLDRLDRFGSVVVAGNRYPLKSLVESGPPPRKK